jgi:hypothetical protein
LHHNLLLCLYLHSQLHLQNKIKEEDSFEGLKMLLALVKKQMPQLQLMVKLHNLLLCNKQHLLLQIP